MESWHADDERLGALIRSNALAGVLYFGSPGTNPAQGLPHIPLATFYYPGVGYIDGVNVIMDNLKMLDCCIQALRRRNYTEISLFSSGALNRPEVLSQPLGDQVLYLAENIRAAGGAFRPDWIQNPEAQNDLATYQITRLLLGNPLNRPQAVILMDDHLFAPVREAIRDLGLRIPHDVELCTLSHERPQTDDEPFIRIGFDTEDFMMKVVTTLSKERRKKPGPTMLDIDFEELTFRKSR